MDLTKTEICKMAETVLKRLDNVDPTFSVNWKHVHFYLQAIETCLTVGLENKTKTRVIAEKLFDGLNCNGLPINTDYADDYVDVLDVYLVSGLEDAIEGEFDVMLEKFHREIGLLGKTAYESYTRVRLEWLVSFAVFLELPAAEGMNSGLMDTIFSIPL